MVSRSGDCHGESAGFWSSAECHSRFASAAQRVSGVQGSEGRFGFVFCREQHLGHMMIPSVN